MATDAEILERIGRAFAACPRPEHFTNYTHCCECFDHDETLRSRDLDTLSMEEVGSPGWDPICFISPEGFAYYLPALARLALSEPDPVWGWYGPQLFWHLMGDGPGNHRWAHCTPAQRQAVAALLDHLFDTRAEWMDSNFCLNDFFRAVEVWSVDDL